MGSTESMATENDAAVVAEYTPEDIARLAKNGAHESEIGAMNASQEMLYWRLKDIYDRFKAGQISKTDGAAAKDIALRRYYAEIKVCSDEDRRLNYVQELHKRIELAAEAYAKDPSIHTADAMFSAFYGGARRKKGDADD